MIDHVGYSEDACRRFLRLVQGLPCIRHECFGSVLLLPGRLLFSLPQDSHPTQTRTWPLGTRKICCSRLVCDNNMSREPSATRRRGLGPQGRGSHSQHEDLPAPTAASLRGRPQDLSQGATAASLRGRGASQPAIALGYASATHTNVGTQLT
jgi:hypothetical protein